MKKLLLLMGMLFSLILLSLPAYSQNRPTITLVSALDGKMTVYDQVNCLQNAISAASDWDVLYLSAGSFPASSSEITIKDKRISLIGSGRQTKVIPDIKVEMSANFAYTQGKNNWNNRPLFDGIILRKIYFIANDESSYSQRNVKITNCSFDSIYTRYVTNITIDDCQIRGYKGGNRGVSQLKNCKIKYLNTNTTEHIENCNVLNFVLGSALYISSSIITKMSPSIPGVTVMDYCLIPSTTAEDQNITNCYRAADIDSILDSETLEAKVDLKAKGYLGMDKTEVGIYGGPWIPYTEIPSVPTVDAKKSSVEYDPTANKLKVNIQMLKESK